MRVNTLSLGHAEPGRNEDFTVRENTYVSCASGAAQPSAGFGAATKKGDPMGGGRPTTLEWHMKGCY